MAQILMSSITSRPVRILAGVTFIALIYFLTLFLRETPQIEPPLANAPGGAWKDPNSERECLGQTDQGLAC